MYLLITYFSILTVIYWELTLTLSRCIEFLENRHALYATCNTN